MGVHRWSSRLCVLDRCRHSARWRPLSELLGAIQQGRPWSQLAEEYFEPTRVALVTVWVHLIVAVAPLSAVAAVVARDHQTRRRQLAILAFGFLFALMVSFAFAERLIVFGYAVAGAFAWAAARRAVGPTAFGNRAASGASSASDSLRS